MSNALKHQEVIRFKQMLTDDNRYLLDELRSVAGEEIVGADFGLSMVMRMVEQVAPLGSPVLLLGETGTGKELIANAIHSSSPRKEGPFIKVNCGAIPETLLDSELFDHEKGAFTGAISQKRGRFERADKGTIFLDEIGDMPLTLQPKLLRLLEERVYEKVGADRQVEADFRIMVATHRNLDECCNQGSFRRDLYHRLNIFPITIPPLRERPEDIPQLAEYFLHHFRQHLGKPLPGLSRAAYDLLLSHNWPGNVRELRNLLEYAAIVTSGDLIRPEHLRLQSLTPCHEAVTSDRISLTFNFSCEDFSLDAVNQQLMTWALEKCGNNKSSAARLLKASRKLFY